MGTILEVSLYLMHERMHRILPGMQKMWTNLKLVLGLNSIVCAKNIVLSFSTELLKQKRDRTGIFHHPQTNEGHPMLPICWE